MQTGVELPSQADRKRLFRIPEKDRMVGTCGFSPPTPGGQPQLCASWAALATWAPRAGLAYCRIWSSTLRFWVRPSRVALSAIGLLSP